MSKNLTPKIVNALMWASMMIATPLLMKSADSGNFQMLLFIQIAGWLMVDQVISKTHFAEGQGFKKCKDFLSRERATFNKIIGKK